MTYIFGMMSYISPVVVVDDNNDDDDSCYLVPDWLNGSTYPSPPTASNIST